MAMKTIFNKDFEAIVYVWVSEETGKMYFGFRKTDDIYDGYVFSSKDEGLITEWSHGKMERHILFTGSVTEAISFEYWILHWAAANGYRDNLYNIKLGGGVVSIDLSVVTEEMQELGIESVKGNFPELIDFDIYTYVDYSLVKSVISSIKTKSGGYIPVSECIDKLVNMGKNQVRQLLLDNTHKNELAEEMLNNTKSARKRITPVIVLVNGNELKVLEGNHRIAAAKKAGWKDLEVIYINYADFDYNKDNLDAFGRMMNKKNEIKKGNSDGDLVHAIQLLWNSTVEKDETVDINNPDDVAKFKDSVYDALTSEETFSKQKINGQWTRAIGSIKYDHLVAGKNFITYEKGKLNTISTDYSKRLNMPIIAAGSKSPEVTGMGGLINLFSRDESFGTKEGMLLLHHTSYVDYMEWKTSKGKLALDREINFLNKFGIKVSYEILPSFDK